MLTEARLGGGGGKENGGENLEMANLPRVNLPWDRGGGAKSNARKNWRLAINKREISLRQRGSRIRFNPQCGQARRKFQDGLRDISEVLLIALAVAGGGAL